MTLGMLCTSYIQQAEQKVGGSNHLFSLNNCEAIERLLDLVLVEKLELLPSA